MAIYDNKHWLLSHIRNSFIISDDTGISEMAMLGEDIPKTMAELSRLECYPGLDMSDEEDDMDSFGQSFDIKSDIGFGIHRQRSNTAQHLERMNQERKRAAGIKHIKWESNPNVLSSEERAALFERKDFRRRNTIPSGKIQSLLADQLEKYPNLPPNPFQDYAKYDGTAQVGMSKRSYGIFLTMLPEEQRNYPMHVVVLANAKVQDLIGLICWKVTQEYGVNKLKDNVAYYGLYIAEDDGEVDWYFPCIDPRETVGKFTFAYLALVELKEAVKQVDNSKDERYSTEISGTTESGTRPKVLSQDAEDCQRMRNHMTAMEAPLYQSYRLYIINKLTKTEILLGISGEKVEIDPVVQQKVASKFWGRQKAVSYDMDNVAACDLTDTKSGGRATFRLVYHHAPSAEQNQPAAASYKHHDFEADHATADEIVQKVNHILELRSSVRRKEYLTLRERKSHRRKSFHLGPR
ncbi:target of rapamycin complex 2 subunit MAPKAP1 [Schistocerca serialis cubense]|uniref:target of rapamycin complex 2 subunit MAPKAP1 n=1 Tax=Schistocerca serialis cubense TaxID=2023355 RepID=UPI00214E3AEC|nr:target of rapamycin complex 2 subunit MAPKAP1 [Schistocerca serialis cubense]